MKEGQEAESDRIIACNQARDKAYLSANLTKAAALEATLVAAKEAYDDAIADIPDAAPGDKADAARTHAALIGKYVADQGYALANSIYHASIEKADAEYRACLVPMAGSQTLPKPDRP